MEDPSVLSSQDQNKMCASMSDIAATHAVHLAIDEGSEAQADSVDVGGESGELITEELMLTMNNT
jgi:hypothetical protein